MDRRIVFISLAALSLLGFVLSLFNYSSPDMLIILFVFLALAVVNCFKPIPVPVVAWGAGVSVYFFNFIVRLPFRYFYGNFIGALAALLTASYIICVYAAQKRTSPVLSGKTRGFLYAGAALSLLSAVATVYLSVANGAYLFLIPSVFAAALTAACLTGKGGILWIIRAALAGGIFVDVLFSVITMLINPKYSFSIEPLIVFATGLYVLIITLLRNKPVFKSN